MDWNIFMHRTFIGKYGQSTEIRVVHDKEVEYAKQTFDEYKNGTGDKWTEDVIAHYLSSNVGSTSLMDYAEDVADVLDAPVVRYDGNCNASAQKQLKNAKLYQTGRILAIQTDVDNVKQQTDDGDGNKYGKPILDENAVGGLIYVMTQLKKGNAVMVGVKEEDEHGNIPDPGNHNRNTGHFVVIN